MTVGCCTRVVQEEVVCTRSGIPRWCVPGPGTVFLYPAWATPPAVRFWSEQGVQLRCTAVVREDALGSDPLPSLGKPPWEVYPAQSSHGSSRISRNHYARAKSRIGQRLDSNRATPPIITLRPDVDGESPIPSSVFRSSRARPEYHHFVTFVWNVTTPSANALRIRLCGDS